MGCLYYLRLVFLSGLFLRRSVTIVDCWSNYVLATKRVFPATGGDQPRSNSQVKDETLYQERWSPQVATGSRPGRRMAMNLVELRRTEHASRTILSVCSSLFPINCEVRPAIAVFSRTLEGRTRRAFKITSFAPAHYPIRKPRLSLSASPYMTPTSPSYDYGSSILFPLMYI